MFVIRWLLGRIILTVNFLTQPKKKTRTSELQKIVDSSTAHLTLYHLPACPFCVKVRRELRRLGLNIELRDIKKHSEYLDELISKGGKRTVPCLKIVESTGQETWLYESKEIIAYLQRLTMEIEPQTKAA